MHRLFSAQLLLAMIASTIMLGSFQSADSQQKQETTPSGSPLQMRLCTGDDCVTLTWRNDHYDGVKDNSSDVVAHYTVEQWSSSGVRIKGKTVNPVGTQQHQVGNIPWATRTYAEATYTGTLAPDGHSVRDGLAKWQVGKLNGEKLFNITWKSDAPTPSAAGCPATVAGTAKPAALEVCDGPCVTAQNGNLGSWIFRGDQGTGSWLKGQRANLRFVQWEGNQITIIREDTPSSNTAGFVATYKGQVCGASIKGTGTGSWPGHFENVDFPWTATIPMTSCDGIDDDPLRLDDIAHEALRFRQLPSAFKCLSHSADLGDMQARTATGLMYRDGIGTKVSYPDALSRFQQSAIQGDYNAEVALSQMYDLGLGVAQDSEKSKDWAARAYNNPIKVAERQNAQNAADAQRLAFLGLSALVEAMAQPEVYIVR